MNNSIAITAQADQKELTPDEQADNVINKMIGAMASTALMQGISLPLVMGAMGTGVVAIGRCYGTELNRDEAWQLIKQFFHAAGLCYVGWILGGRILTMIIAATGAGYIAAVTIDATASASLGYAIGAASKAYFKGERNKKALGAAMRKKFKENHAH